MYRIFCLLVLSVSISLYAQSSVAGYIGVGSSAFDFEDYTLDPEDQAGWVPIGAQITLGEGMIQFGGELTLAVVPFTFEYEMNGSKVGELQVTQLFAGGFLRINIGNEAIQPYVKAGGGAYVGKLKWEPEDQFAFQAPETEENFKTAFGFYGSVGLDVKIGRTLAIFGEIPFHVVERKLDLEDVPDEDNEGFTANHWAIIAGVRILFK